MEASISAISCRWDSVVAALIAVLIRWCISLNPYSGKGKPPMYGDYEAQRHWMELTTNLPISQWYFESPNNNLSYWGIDYPPLTAYHMWICGQIAKTINPKWVELNTSHGYESADHQLFMRYTDILSRSCKSVAFLLVLINITAAGYLVNRSWPFSVSLTRDQDLLGACAFTLALNYKQMELYHSLPFFCYLLGKSLRSSKPLLKIIALGLVVIITFGLCWLPFLFDINQAIQVIKRLFPFNRGLYEDKVSNVWCTLNIVIKLRQLYSQQTLIGLSFCGTIIAVLPSSIHLILYPTLRRLLIALVNCSLAFFLFSFQVHEKSVLIACMPVSLLLPWHPAECGLFLLWASFSMVPLLIKDGLIVAYIAIMLLYLCLLYLSMESHYHISSYQKYLYGISIMVMLAIHGYSSIVIPPKRYPDLVAVLISATSCCCYLMFLIFYNYLQFVTTDNLLNAPLISKSKSE